MGRKNREIASDVSYHVYSRCIDKQDLMEDDWVKELMYNIIEETQTIYDFELNSISILDNHFHFIIKINNDIDTISKIMQRIKSVFARRYNRFYGRTGPFWNERFGSSIIEKAKDTMKYIVHLLWYIAYNSVRKGKSVDPRNYKYSSINAYLDESYRCPLKITLHRGFLNLGMNLDECIKKFIAYEKTYMEYLGCQR